MTIKSWSTPTPESGAYGQRKPMASKSAGSVQFGHRTAPVPGQGLAHDFVPGSNGPKGLPTQEVIRAMDPLAGDAGADWAQDDFERRHDRRSSDKLNARDAHLWDGVDEGEPRIDSLNFPSDKDW